VHLRRTLAEVPSKETRPVKRILLDCEKRVWPVVILGSIVLILALFSYNASGLKVAPVMRGESIPLMDDTRVEYRSWSLFLVCNPKWLLPDKKAELQSLYEQFRAFGRAIGPRHLAVWFWSLREKGGADWKTEASVAEQFGISSKAAERMVAQDFASYVDVDRASHYCSAYGLSPSHGPHIIVTTHYPDSYPGDHAPEIILELNNLKPSEITDYLGAVTDQLSAGKLAKMDVEKPRYWLMWKRSFEATRSAFLGLKDIKISINAGIVKAELQGATPAKSR